MISTPTTATGLGALKWNNADSARVLVIFLALQRIGVSLGYKSMAGYFWLHGYSALLCQPPGTDGIVGEYDMRAWLEECNHAFDVFTQDNKIPDVDAIGSCAGGAVAAHLWSSAFCADLGEKLAAFKTQLFWSQSYISEFRTHAFDTGIHPSERCFPNLLHLTDALVDDRASCLFGHNDDLRMPFTSANLAELKRVVPNHTIVTIDHASHGLLKRGPTRSLLKSCEAANRYFQAHAS